MAKSPGSKIDAAHSDKKDTYLEIIKDVKLNVRTYKKPRISMKSSRNHVAHINNKNVQKCKT